MYVVYKYNCINTTVYSLYYFTAVCVPNGQC
uniref:Uncharacterized protein n=1 Tax=Arundo donax TaxID=35708 RepID=A0A0A8YHL8_ARUDO